MINRSKKAGCMWRKLVSAGAGIALVVVLAGCNNAAPTSSENVVKPGSMSNDQQKQYEDRMKTMGRPGYPGGSYPGGGGYPGGAPASMPHK